MFAPSSSWRTDVVPRDAVGASRPANDAPGSPANRQAKKTKKKTSGSDADAILAPTPQPADTATTSPGPKTSLGAGVVRPAFARIDWASLLWRVYLEDVLACPCGGRRRLVADVTEKATIEAILTAILTHLRLPAETPPLARARAPDHDAA